MSKSVRPYRNALHDPAACTPLPGLLDHATFCTLGHCGESGECPHLTGFAPGASSNGRAI